MNLNNMKKVILVGLVFSVFTTQTMAQTNKAVKALNTTKDAVAKIVTLDPIDVVAEYVSKKKDAVSDLYSPVSGNVVESNDDLVSSPETCNAAPYTDAWMIKVKLQNQSELSSLLTPAQYEDYLATL